MHPMIEQFLTEEREKRLSKLRDEAKVLLDETIKRHPEIGELLKSNAMRFDPETCTLHADGITKISIRKYGDVVHFAAHLTNGAIGGLYPDFFQALLAASRFASRGTKMACRNCKFFASVSGNLGECRRNAPSVGGVSLWPTVPADGWCGEFELQPEEVILT